MRNGSGTGFRSVKTISGKNFYSVQVCKDVNIGFVLANAPIDVIWSVEIAHGHGFSRCPAQLVSGSRQAIWAPKLIRSRCCEVSTNCLQ